MPLRIMSGGQTGVDRAALDAARQAGLPCGGWCPAGRRAEDGVIPDRYPLRETPTVDYAERTHLNVRDSDATLILARGPLVGGTALTREEAEALARPVLVLDPTDPKAVREARRWMRQQHAIRTLNIAGPRESTEPGIYAETLAFLTQFFAADALSCSDER
ncbi:MAG: molybdenum cofactor carrier [Rhodothermaceae bacterium]|nr:molybdenum cofactor carrier [Rhodothermaceae bacterium]